MDFGLFYYCQGRGVAHDQAYAEMLDQIALAETLGFGECWFAEHHFTDYSLLPSPNLMIAAALQRTTRMRFGNYVNVLPFHHPLRLAAEAATLDNLARGQFDFGIGKGVRPGEFTKLGLSFDDAPDMTEEAIEILLKLWREDTASHDGRFWRFHELSLRPRAFQRPHPPLHMVASRPASAARVGARGWPVAMHFTPTDAVARCVEEYRAAVAARTGPAGEGPYRPRLLLCRETYVAETAATARAEGALALQGFWYLSSLALARAVRGVGHPPAAHPSLNRTGDCPGSRPVRRRRRSVRRGTARGRARDRTGQPPSPAARRAPCPAHSIAPAARAPPRPHGRAPRRQRS
jgi:alkanesulfonate monooxygenase SsuD/methylene tetrahydromethanopterin reductase-like flavin-dependent oxidoreductase (luciferase family)